MDESRAWNYCLWLLGRSARTEAELRQRMQGKEATPATIDDPIILEEIGEVLKARGLAG